MRITFGAKLCTIKINVKLLRRAHIALCQSLRPILLYSESLFSLHVPVYSLFFHNVDLWNL